MCGRDTYVKPGRFYVDKNKPIPLKGLAIGIQEKEKLKITLPSKWGGGEIKEDEIVQFSFVSIITILSSFHQGQISIFIMFDTRGRRKYRPSLYGKAPMRNMCSLSQSGTMKSLYPRWDMCAKPCMSGTWKTRLSETLWNLGRGGYVNSSILFQFTSWVVKYFIFSSPIAAGIFTIVLLQPSNEGCLSGRNVVYGHTPADLPRLIGYCWEVQIQQTSHQGPLQRSGKLFFVVYTCDFILHEVPVLFPLFRTRW